jgi:phosphoserine phosphatase RsbU/P
VVVLDHHFPRHDGLFLLRELRELGSRVPVIALTGTDESALAVELMKNGAVDFMPKVGLTAHRLALGVRHAQRVAVSELAKGALEEALRSCEELNRQLLETSADCIKTIDPDGRILSMSAAGLRALEIDNAAQLRQQCWFEFWEEPHRSEAKAAVETAMAGGTARFTGECLSRTGKSTWWSVVLSPLRGASGRPERVLAISRAIEPA